MKDIPDTVLEHVTDPPVFTRPEGVEPLETEDYRAPAWIVDIDGTLALNLKGRSPYDYSRVHEDDPCPIITELVQMLAERYEIIICSGREDNCRTATQNWLHQHKIPYTNLFMRKTGDYRKDSEVKLEILDNYILPSFDVRGVLDDRQQVVDAWRSRGYKTLQVAPGDF